MLTLDILMSGHRTSTDVQPFPSLVPLKNVCLEAVPASVTRLTCRTDVVHALVYVLL